MSEQKIMTISSQQYYDEKIKSYLANEVTTHNNSNAAHDDIRKAVDNLETLVGSESVSKQIDSAINSMGIDQATVSEVKTYLGI